jgi:hypothetical protein
MAPMPDWRKTSCEPGGVDDRSFHRRAGRLRSRRRNRRPRRSNLREVVVAVVVVDVVDVVVVVVETVTGNRKY